ncbi:hypothetical protein BTR25_13700 [Bacillus sp. MRMR6]|nr:hypothetical protein BTR25_13700 [Bacillus sp. MRMR6]
MGSINRYLKLYNRKKEIKSLCFFKSKEEFPNNIMNQQQICYLLKKDPSGNGIKEIGYFFEHKSVNPYSGRIRMAYDVSLNPNFLKNKMRILLKKDELIKEKHKSLWG